MPATVEDDRVSTHGQKNNRSVRADLGNSLDYHSPDNMAGFFLCTTLHEKKNKFHALII